MGGEHFVLPAYAGMILDPAPSPTWAPSAPRVCGDDPTRPRARYQPEAVLPAYAGMIPEFRIPAGDAECAPRVCGDDPLTGRIA